MFTIIQNNNDNTTNSAILYSWYIFNLIVLNLKNDDYLIYAQLIAWILKPRSIKWEIQLTRPALQYVYKCFADGYSICIRNIQNTR